MSSELRAAVEGCKSVRARCSNPAKFPDVRRLWMAYITAGENRSRRAERQLIHRVAKSGRAARRGFQRRRFDDPLQLPWTSGLVLLSGPKKCAAQISMRRAGRDRSSRDR
jgi:hypothetical protein